MTDVRAIATPELLPLVYDELRRLASQKLANKKPRQPLQATPLVQEAFVRLVDIPLRSLEQLQAILCSRRQSDAAHLDPARLATGKPNGAPLDGGLIVGASNLACHSGSWRDKLLARVSPDHKHTSVRERMLGSLSQVVSSTEFGNMP